MATGAFEGTNYALMDTPAIGTFIDGKLRAGKVRCSIDTCFASGSDLDAGSTMHVAKLPKGAIVLFAIVTPMASTGIATAMSNAVTGVLGFTGDTNALGAIGALNSTTPQVIRPVPDGTTYTGMTPLTEDKDVFITTADQDLTAGEGVEVKIFYSLT